MSPNVIVRLLYPVNHNLSAGILQRCMQVKVLRHDLNGVPVGVVHDNQGAASAKETYLWERPTSSQCTPRLSNRCRAAWMSGTLKHICWKPWREKEGRTLPRG